MKKFIIPALISVVFLTSCSKALYKDKYDWVKVTPSSQHETRADSVAGKAEVFTTKSAPEIALHTMESIVANHSDSAKAVKENRAQEVTAAVVNGAERVTIDSLANPKTALNDVVHAAKQNHSKKERKALCKNGLDSDIDWLQVGGAVAGLIACILIIVYWHTPAVQVVIFALQLLEVVFGIAAVVLMLYGLWWLFDNFLFMMDH